MAHQFQDQGGPSNVDAIPLADLRNAVHNGQGTGGSQNEQHTDRDTRRASRLHGFIATDTGIVDVASNGKPARDA